MVAIRAFVEGQQTRIEVTDTGPGISTEVRERLFVPFARGSERAGGSGLGLATVRRLVEAHDGEIEVGGEPGQGTVFTIRLPRP